MPKADSAPTLWRTCRILANRKRLEILRELLRHQPQSVSQLATKLHLTLPTTSQCLRALESRGFLKVKRTRRRVEYRLTLPTEAEHLGPLLNSIRGSLRENPGADGRIFEFATGFTHPTRIEICRLLKSAPRDLSQLQAILQRSRFALDRHLQKLILPRLPQIRAALLPPGHQTSSRGRRTARPGLNNSFCPHNEHRHPLGAHFAKCAQPSTSDHKFGRRNLKPVLATTAVAALPPPCRCDCFAPRCSIKLEAD